MDLDQLSRVDNGGVLELDRLELVVGELVVNDFGVISATGKVGVGHQWDVYQLSKVDSGRVLELDSLKLVVNDWCHQCYRKGGYGSSGGCGSSVGCGSAVKGGQWKGAGTGQSGTGGEETDGQ